MKNLRITPKERNLIKGAIRRVFSRSELRREVIRAAIIDHSDPSRKRVKTWAKCNVCKQPEAISNIVVDHINPVVPIEVSFEEMSFDTLVNNIWCDRINLQPICPSCHRVKSKEENRLRRERKKKDERDKKGTKRSKTRSRRATSRNSRKRYHKGISTK